MPTISPDNRARFLQKTGHHQKCHKPVLHRDGICNGQFKSNSQLNCVQEGGNKPVRHTSHLSYLNGVKISRGGVKIKWVKPKLNHFARVTSCPSSKSVDLSTCLWVMLQTHSVRPTATHDHHKTYFSDILTCTIYTHQQYYCKELKIKKK